jgi:hypothetical protein
VVTLLYGCFHSAVLNPHSGRVHQDCRSELEDLIGSNSKRNKKPQKTLLVIPTNHHGLGQQGLKALREGLPVCGCGYPPDGSRNLVPANSKGSAKVSIRSFNIMILLNNFTDTVEDPLNGLGDGAGARTYRPQPSRGRRFNGFGKAHRPVNLTRSVAIGLDELRRWADLSCGTGSFP